MKVPPIGRIVPKIVILLILGVLIASAQRARLSTEAAATPSSLPNTTDVTASRGVGPFNEAQAREWHDAAESLCAQSRYGEAEKLYAKLLEEREDRKSTRLNSS